MKKLLFYGGLVACCSVCSLQAEEVVDLNNEICPVMGNPVDKDDWIVYEGQKIYFCCPGCDKKFLKNPDKYMKRLKSNGKNTSSRRRRSRHG